MKLNIIHLYGTSHSAERMINVQSQLYAQNISDYEIWPGISGDPAYIGINKAHKQVVRWAKENNLPEVCIAEDDIVFIGEGAFEFYSKNKPEEFDIYLGGISQILKRDSGVIKEFTGFTLYTVHSRFYDRYLSATDNDHIDRAMKDLGDYYLCKQVVCTQMPGYSYNKKRFMNYGHLLKQHEIYTPKEKNIS